MIRRVNVEGVIRLPAFSHASIAGDFIFVAGMLGSPGDELVVVTGGIQAETRQTLLNIEQILRACGAELQDVVKVNVFLRDMDDYQAMNQAYLDVFGDDPPARITVGRADLALGAAVEIDCVAYRPEGLFTRNEESDTLDTHPEGDR